MRRTDIQQVEGSDGARLTPCPTPHPPMTMWFPSFYRANVARGDAERQQAEAETSHEHLPIMLLALGATLIAGMLLMTLIVFIALSL